ncbi:hypothetical protein C8R46DRAFT_1043570 [Mycena filopes]|nr:hypothetical protein C8R46DRAFT_1043570 [Mycena filopes]
MSPALVVREDNVPGTQAVFLRSRRQFPEEILLTIFRLALPPSWRGDPGNWAPPFPFPTWSSDVRTKLAFLRVCKTWYRIMLELLYQNVELRQIGQLVALTRTLENRPELGGLVQALKLCHIPHRRYRALHDAEMNKLFGLCPAVTDLTFDPVPESSIFVLGNAHAITTLDLSDAARYSAVLPLLNTLSLTLESLSLTLHATYPLYPPLTFRRLQNLRLGAGTKSAVFPTAHWVLPCLQRLSFRHNTDLGFDLGLDLVCTVLAACGPLPTLTHLHLAEVLPQSHSIRVAGHHDTLLDVLSWCPALQHLTTTQELLVRLAGSPPHASLRSLDMLGDHRGVIPDAYLTYLQRAFPALRAYRAVDGPRAYFLDTDATPLWERGGWTPAARLPVPVLVDTARDYCIAANSCYAVLIEHADDDMDADDRDEDFVFQDEDDDGGSATATDSDREEEDGGSDDFDAYPESSEDEDSDEEQVGAEEALAIYRRTLELRAGREEMWSRGGRG